MITEFKTAQNEVKIFFLINEWWIKINGLH
jgi:hypothetical protein